MYRYSVDNAVTYTSEDFVLFRESPFACWMERLTLENPDHGIPPDVGSNEPSNTMERQDDLVDTLRADGRDVVLVDWEQDEPKRRSATLEAMRGGADFIVNGQLALGPLSGSANLLMRTSGYSELGDFLYIPCDTQAKTTLHSAFRLCFLADLLHSLQGQLPPQMLIIRGGADVMPMESEDHIYHYRAVKQRFMDAMRNFRKHRMPDPAESSHFGRWSDCANEVLKQRALTDDQQAEATPEDDVAMPLLQMASAAGEGTSLLDLDVSPQADAPLAPLVAENLMQQQPVTQTVTRPIESLAVTAAPTTPSLADQARMLTPGAYSSAVGASRPGSTPNLARARSAKAPPEVADDTGAGGAHLEHNRRSSDDALEDLEFIGSSHRVPSIGANLSRAQTLIEDVPVEPAMSAESVFGATSDVDAPVPNLGAGNAFVEADMTAALREDRRVGDGPLAGGAPAPGPALTDWRESQKARRGIDQSAPGSVASGEPQGDTGFSNDPPLDTVGQEESTPILDAPAQHTAPPDSVTTYSPSLDEKQPVEASNKPVKPHPLDSTGFSASTPPVVDLDSAPPASLNPAREAPRAGFEVDIIDDSAYLGLGTDTLAMPELASPDEDLEQEIEPEDEEESRRLYTFSDSLITNDHFED
jgi:hypothetical protein